MEIGLTERGGMAGDWIPITTNIHTKPEVVRISCATMRTRFEVVGLLCAFWAWASDHSTDGKLRVQTDQLIELIGGDLDFWKQVEAIGWLKVTPQGVVVPHFEKWLSRGAKRRIRHAERARNVRKLCASKAHKKRTTGQDRTEHTDPPNGGSVRARKLFTKPTVEEIAAYCQERGNSVDPQRFWDHYESNGWKVGKNPMKDWKAAVRTWEGNERNGASRDKLSGLRRVVEREGLV